VGTANPAQARASGSSARRALVVVLLLSAMVRGKSGFPFRAVGQRSLKNGRGP